MKIRLVHEVLDQQLLDADDENSGKVDGIVLELRDGLPPRVAFIEVGPITLLRRFSAPLARRYARFDARFGEGRGRPIRIPWSRVEKQDVSVKMDVRAESTPIVAVERWLREHIVGRIPGASK